MASGDGKAPGDGSKPTGDIPTDQHDEGQVREAINHTIIDEELPSFLLDDTGRPDLSALVGHAPDVGSPSKPRSDALASAETLAPFTREQSESPLVPPAMRNLKAPRLPTSAISPALQSEQATMLDQRLDGALGPDAFGVAESVEPEEPTPVAQASVPPDLAAATMLDFRVPDGIVPLVEPTGDIVTQLDPGLIESNVEPAMRTEVQLELDPRLLEAAALDSASSAAPTGDLVGLDREMTQQMVLEDPAMAPARGPSQFGVAANDGVFDAVTPSAPVPEPRLSDEQFAEMSNVERFGRYILLGRVGEGGMADVRLACQTGPHGYLKPCVIKRIAEELTYEDDVREMFVEEARLGERLHHANIVKMFDYDELDDVPFMAMELIDGANLSSLSAFIGDADMPLDVVVEIGKQVADALAYAHGLVGPDGAPLDIIHRDVSPQNVLVSRHGEVKLADFGIARFIGRMHKTAIGPPKGKLRYLSPEQLRYQPMDHRVDIFALGITLTELLGGRALMLGGVLVVDDMPALVRERCGTRRDAAPPELIGLLVQMTALNADQRPGTAAEVSQRLDAVQRKLRKRVELSDFAAQQIAARLPSAETTIFTILGRRPGEAPASPDRVRAPSIAPSIDLSQTINSVDAGGFPTMAHFILAAEVERSSGSIEKPQPSQARVSEDPAAGQNASQGPLTPVVPAPQPAAPAQQPGPVASAPPVAPRPVAAAQRPPPVASAPATAPPAKARPSRTGLVIALMVGALVLGMAAAFAIREAFL